MEKQNTNDQFTAERIVFADYRQMQFTADVANETPLSLVYGGIPYVVMMTTPADLEDFVYGFSLTEGIIERVDDILDITFTHKADTIIANIGLSARRFQAHLAKRRMMSGRTSCGLCGVETIADLPMAHKKAYLSPVVSMEAINQALANLEPAQSLNKITRSVHAAAWCDRQGQIIDLREDVGRHNALDKVIGCVLKNKSNPQDGFMLITSRASFEMVEKTAMFGADTLVAISAPTSLAIRRAQALGVAFFAVARHDSIIKFTSGSVHAEEMLAI